MTIELKAQVATLTERVIDLELDLGRITTLFGHSIDDVTATVADVRALMAKTGDHSVNAMLAVAMKNRPNLAAARNAIDRELLALPAKVEPVAVEETKHRNFRVPEWAARIIFR